MSEVKPSFAIKALRLPEKALFFGLSSSELLILARIVMFTKDGTQTAFYSNSQAVNDLQFSLRTVMRSFRSLEEQKIIFSEFVKVNGVNQRQITLNLLHPMFMNEDIDNLTIDKKTMVKMTIVKKSQKGSQNDHDPLVKMTTTPSQNDHPTIRNIYKEINKDNNKENIYSENSQKTDESKDHDSVFEQPKIAEHENETQDFALTPVPLEPRRGANSDTARDRNEGSAENALKKRNKAKPKNIEEVVAYMTTYLNEKQNDYPFFVNISPNKAADAFYGFYESKGWTVGKSPMKDWKAAAGRCLREWTNVRNTTKQTENSDFDLNEELKKWGFDVPNGTQIEKEIEAVVVDTPLLNKF